MTNVIDLDARRKGGGDDGDYILVCECGCAIFRIYMDGDVMCLNCDAELEHVIVVPDLPKK